jgi:hypothetical protein
MSAEVRWTQYAFPCEIHSERVQWDAANQAYLNVHLWVTKREKTPDTIQYDLDDLVPTD